MVKVTEEAQNEYVDFKKEYTELIHIGEEFIKKKVFKGHKLEKYNQVKDGLVYYVYHHFPELYDKYFVGEPRLPKISIWYYILNDVLWISDKLLNPIWWPRYGENIVEYMTYYNQKLTQIAEELVLLEEVVDDQE